MPNKISTGIKGLDRDLQVLFDLCEDKQRLDAIAKILQNPNASVDELKNVIPQSILKLAGALNGINFPLIMDSVSDETKPTLLEARNLINAYFQSVFLHSSSKDLVRDIIKSEEDEETEKLSQSNIASVEPIESWIGVPPKLIPSVRVGLKNYAGKIVLDSTLDCEDLSSLISAFTTILNSLLENGQELAKSQQIDKDIFKDFAKQIKETEEKIASIKKLSEKYGVKFTS